MDLGIPIFILTPLYTDSDSSKCLAFNDTFFDRTKHVEVKVDCHFIRQHIRDDNIQLSCIFHQPSCRFLNAGQRGAEG